VTNAKGVDFGSMPNGIFRFKPDGSAMEMVCAYGSNTWGMDFTWTASSSTRWRTSRT